MVSSRRSDVTIWFSAMFGKNTEIAEKRYITGDSQYAFHAGMLIQVTTPGLRPSVGLKDIWRIYPQFNESDLKQEWKSHFICWIGFVKMHISSRLMGQSNLFIMFHTAKWFLIHLQVSFNSDHYNNSIVRLYIITKKWLYNLVTS